MRLRRRSTARADHAVWGTLSTGGTLSGAARSCESPPRPRSHSRKRIYEYTPWNQMLAQPALEVKVFSQI